MRSHQTDKPNSKLNREANVVTQNDITAPRENILDRSAWEAIRQLGSFVNDAEFFSKMETVFGEKIDLKNLMSASLPSLQILPADSLNGANGAYSVDTNTIYLSKEFINSNLENPRVISDLLLEEIGHTIDNILNQTDTPGDEGEHFAAVVNGIALSPKEMNRIMSEDDSGTIIVDGKTIAIEQQTFNGTSGNDSIAGTAGDDTISPGLGRDTVDGADGNDLLVVDYSTNTYTGSSYSSNKAGITSYSYDASFDDYSYVKAYNSSSDYDKVDYRHIERLEVTGTPHNDRITTGDGNDILNGGDGNDRLIGDMGHDFLSGGTDKDTLKGSGGHDTLAGGKGDDLLIGEGGNDSLTAGEGSDKIIGNNGNDYLSGKEENDILVGGRHDDTLIGGAGKDVLLGQAGQDTFVLLTDLSTDDRDIIRDFELGTDVLGVSDLTEVNDLSVANNFNNTASIVTGADGQQVAILQNITGVTMSDFDFVEI